MMAGSGFEDFQGQAGQPVGGASGGRGRRFWFWALALCLAVVLVLVLGVGFVFKDRLFGGPANGSAGESASGAVNGSASAPERQNKAAQGGSDKTSLKEYCIPDGNVCFDYPAGYTAKFDKAKHIVNVYDTKGKQIVYIHGYTANGFGGCPTLPSHPTTEVFDVQETQLKGIKSSSPTGVSSEAKLVSMVRKIDTEDPIEGNLPPYALYVHLTTDRHYQKVGELNTCMHDDKFLSSMIEPSEDSPFGIYYIMQFQLGTGKYDDPDMYYPDRESAKAALDKPEFKEGIKILQSVHWQKK